MKNDIHLLVGTFALGKDNGIRIYRFDQNTGESEAIGIYETDFPTYLTTSKNGKFVYSVSENGEMPSYINAFSYNKQKEDLDSIDSIHSGDDGSCYINIDENNKHVLTANYGGGSISVFDLDTNGQFYKMSQLIVFEGKGVDLERQTQSHIHCVEFTPDGKCLLATDLGADRIYQLEIDDKCNECEKEFVISKSIGSTKVPDGSGPRHIVFHPEGKYLYLINELSDTIIVFSYNDGKLAELQEIPVIENGAGGSADVVITPDGNYLYGSVRLKEDGIAIFRVNTDGTLEKIGYQLTGIHPRNLRITPNGKFLLAACKDSSRIEVYRISADDGSIEHIDKDIDMVEPACMRFV